jgi:signal transduction histidine kinase
MSATPRPARDTPPGFVQLLRPTIRLRVALIFAVLFLAAGAGVLALNYAVLDHSLHTPRAVGAKVPSWSAWQVIRQDEAIIKGPGPELDKAAARGQLALALLHPHARLIGSLLPAVNTKPAVNPQEQAAEARAYNDALHQLLRQSALILLPLALLAIALGWLVAAGMLRPLRRLTATARQLSASRLHQRLHLQGRNDELKELGGTFDAMLARLEAAFESQRRFVANASHELRTPLTIMRTELEVTLDKGQASPQDLRAMGEVVRTAVTRSERLVDGLLTLAESERGLARTEPVDLAELVPPALSQVAAAARQADIQVTTTLAPAPVTGTRVLLERLIENLADNGVRHNRPRGWLTIRTAKYGDTSELTAENSGPHITPDEAASLFEPFRRLHADRVGSARGSGLGLSIVQAAARAHGGDAAAAPLAEGGLRVTVRLPATPPPTSRPDTTRHAVAAAQTR